MRTFWQHNNGMVYVVESDSFGTITGAAGPLEPGHLGDPTDYTCSPGILGWLNHAIIEKKIRRVNPTGPLDAVPCPIARLQMATRQPAAASGQVEASEPPEPDREVARAHPQIEEVPAKKPEAPPPDATKRELTARKKFAWSSAYGL